MTDLEGIFADLGIAQYLDIFLDQGFDSWDTILDITESDFDTLGVKLGHRRKLQRRIADFRGISADTSLGSPGAVAATAEYRSGEERKGPVKGDSKPAAGKHGAKRKYRRHPKPDENAPERPPSAYVIFSNKMRDDMKERQLSFTEIAKLVGEHWQSQSPEEKDVFEQQAFAQRERFNAEMSEYKKTDNYATYAAYLAEFKARQAGQQQVAGADIAKRPKLTVLPSTSSGTVSTASQHDHYPATRSRAVSVASGASHLHNMGDSMSPISKAAAISPTPLLMDAVTSTQSSPGMLNLTFGADHREPLPTILQQLGPRRADATREDATRHAPATQTSARSVDVGTLSDAPPPCTARHRVERVDHVPPMLTHGSTSDSTTSANSYFTPRTPIEPSLERILPMPANFPQKAGSFEGVLAPIRPPSMSPQTSVFGNKPSPSPTPPLMSMLSSSMSTPTPPSYPGVKTVDFQQHIAPLRNLPPPTPGALALPPPRPLSPTAQHTPPRDPTQESPRPDAPEVLGLDPVSALLRAGEIVDRQTKWTRPLPGVPKDQDRTEMSRDTS